ncbi:hypothetical protein SNEBB_001059 [Seison nebaliae]|nr:hypothetical protein SNEBB_001059 [Seison nebaliae]
MHINDVPCIYSCGCRYKRSRGKLPTDPPHNHRPTFDKGAMTRIIERRNICAEKINARLRAIKRFRHSRPQTLHHWKTLAYYKSINDSTTRPKYERATDLWEKYKTVRINKNPESDDESLQDEEGIPDKMLRGLKAKEYSNRESIKKAERFNDKESGLTIGSKLPKFGVREAFKPPNKLYSWWSKAKYRCVDKSKVHDET